VTDISHSLYLATKIRRNQAGDVEEVLAAEGFGKLKLSFSNLSQGMLTTILQFPPLSLIHCSSPFEA